MLNYQIKLNFHLIIQILIILFCIIGIIYVVIKDLPAEKQLNEFLDYNRLYLKAKPQEIDNEYNLISDNSIKAVSPAYYILEVETLGSLIEEPKNETIDDLFKKIIWCESKGDYTAKNPKSTAYGICQILDGTWNYIQKKWDIELNRYSTSDQEYACKRLLTEEGLSHWQPVWSCINNYEN